MRPARLADRPRAIPIIYDSCGSPRLGHGQQGNADLEVTSSAAFFSFYGIGKRAEARGTCISAELRSEFSLTPYLRPAAMETTFAGGED